MRVPMINLGRLLLLATAFALAAWGCQGPDAFYRDDAGHLDEGVGGHSVGVGGTQGEGGAGTGGMEMGTGGMTMTMGTGGMAMGTGGRTTGVGGGAMGTGGKVTGTGGKVTGTGGMVAGTGGMVTGTGGKATGTGGKATGTGGKVAGTGGMVTGTGGATGTTPCSGLCAAGITVTEFTVTSMTAYGSGNFNTANALCYETTDQPTRGNCSNFNSRTLSINGTDVTAMCSLYTVPAARNGGFCFQVSAGTETFASFSTYY